MMMMICEFMYWYWWGWVRRTQKISICTQKCKNKKHDKIYAPLENRRGPSFNLFSICNNHKGSTISQNKTGFENFPTNQISLILSAAKQLSVLFVVKYVPVYHKKVSFFCTWDWPIVRHWYYLQAKK